MTIEVISRNDARAQGHKKFFTGVQCKHGHLAERRVVDGKCCKCVSIAGTIRSKRWVAANREKSRASVQKWRAENPEVWKASNRKSKQANQQKYTDRQRADYALNPEKYRTAERRRRARKKGNGGTHSPADLAEIFAAQGGRCAYCKIDLKKAKKHVDHIVALAAGGSNDRSNAQYTCEACNKSKGAKDPIAFAQTLGLLL